MQEELIMISASFLKNICLNNLHKIDIFTKIVYSCLVLSFTSIFYSTKDNSYLIYFQNFTFPLINKTNAF